jgi:ABC-type sugar transport system ATPase subunit
MVLELIRGVRDHGLAVIMVSHNLPEVFAVADRITVMRLGRTITTLARDETSLDAIVAMMTGAAAAAA